MTDFDFNAVNVKAGVKEPTAKEKKKAEKEKAKSADKMVEKLAEQKSTETIKKEEEYIAKIGNVLGGRFKSFLEGQGFDVNVRAYKNKNADQLKETYERMRCAIANKGSADWLPAILQLGIVGVESATASERLKNVIPLQGLSQMLFKNESFLDIVEELRLDYTSISAMGPEKRLAMVVGHSAFQVVLANKRVQAIQQERDRKIAAEKAALEAKEAAEPKAEMKPMQPDAPEVDSMEAFRKALAEEEEKRLRESSSLKPAPVKEKNAEGGEVAEEKSVDAPEEKKVEEKVPEEKAPEEKTPEERKYEAHVEEQTPEPVEPEKKRRDKKKKKSTPKESETKEKSRKSRKSRKQPVDEE